MGRFWASSNNKLKLQLLIHQEALAMSIEKSMNGQLLVSNFTGMITGRVPCYSCNDKTCVEIPELVNDIEEADARIILHSMHAAKNGIDKLVILSSDTDVSVIIMYYWDKLHSQGICELWMKAGISDSTRYIPIHSLSSRVGADLCQVLPAVHTLTGCDYTSKFGTKSAALKVNSYTFLKDFGVSSEGPRESVLESAEKYLVQVLKKGTQCLTMDQLRNYQYHHSKNFSIEHLPPTSHATKYHILRAYYATYEMISILSRDKITLNPVRYGFQEIDDLLIPDKALRYIPEEYALQCKCLKCATERCLCRQNFV